MPVALLVAFLVLSFLSSFFFGSTWFFLTHQKKTEIIINMPHKKYALTFTLIVSISFIFMPPFASRFHFVF